MSETGPSLQRPATRAARLSAIEQALATHIITSQSQLSKILIDEGIAVTQATLSRDLDEMHAVKTRLKDGTVAYMSLLENEMRRFQFQQGDSEGFVNYALTIKKVKMSAMFLAHRKFIRVSLRSRGDVDVNLFARKYFSGGGHKNAAGGKSFVSMQETIDHYVRSVREFADEGHLG